MASDSQLSKYSDWQAARLEDRCCVLQQISPSPNLLWGPTNVLFRRYRGFFGAWGGAALLVGRSRDRFPVVSLNFSVTSSLGPHHGPGVDSAPSENKYQEYFLGVKAVGE